MTCLPVFKGRLGGETVAGLSGFLTSCVVGACGKERCACGGWREGWKECCS